MKKGLWVWIGIGVLAALVVAGALWSAKSTEDGSPLFVGSGESSRTAGNGGDADGDAEPSEAPPADGTSKSASPTPQVPPVPTVAEPPAQGAVLVTITTPPAKTLAFIDAGVATPGSEYAVEFRVYGIGPGAAGSSVVVAIDKSTPAAGVAKPFAFTGRNVLLKLSSDAARVVDVGGAYTGTIKLREQEGMLEPWLVDARAK